MQSESEMDVDRFHPWIGVGSDCVAVAVGNCIVIISVQQHIKQQKLQNRQ